MSKKIYIKPPIEEYVCFDRKCRFSAQKRIMTDDKPEFHSVIFLDGHSNKLNYSIHLMHLSESEQSQFIPESQLIKFEFRTIRRRIFLNLYELPSLKASELNKGFSTSQGYRINLFFSQLSFIGIQSNISEFHSFYLSILSQFQGEIATKL